MEQVCDQCGRSFTRKPGSRRGRFCSRACYHAYRPGRQLKQTVVKYRMRTARDHPIAPPSGIVPVSRLVLFEKIGPGPHPCHWCGKQIDWLPGGPFVPGALLSDHVDFDTNNDTPENLVPSCNTCNGHRTREMNKQLIAEGEKTMLWSGRRTRAVERQCERCGEPFLTIPAEVGKGKGRFCSRSCARSKSAA